MLSYRKCVIGSLITIIRLTKVT